MTKENDLCSKFRASTVSPSRQGQLRDPQAECVYCVWQYLEDRGNFS